MNKKTLLSILLIFCGTSVYAESTVDTTKTYEVDEVVVSARYVSNVSLMGQDQPLRSIPQSVSVVNPIRMVDMNITTIDQAMQYVTGVTTIANDYMRSQYKSRGYSLSVMNDGLPSYNALAISQQLDLSFYDQVEVLRGPMGIFQGVPDGSSLGGIINLVKKTPHQKLEVNTLASVGSWSNFRGEIDLNAPILKNGKLNTRWVFFINDREFFYDKSDATKMGAYGVVEWQATKSSLFSVSYAYQKANGDVLYNGLPAMRETSDDPSRNHLDVDRHFNPTPDWDYTKWETHEVLFKYEQKLAEKWNLDVKFNWRGQNQENKYGFAGTVTLADTSSNYLRGYNDEQIPRFSGAANVNGKFKMFGWEQNFLAGFNFEHFVDDKQYLSAYYKTKFGDPFNVPDFQIPYDMLNHSKMRVIQGGLYAQFRLLFFNNLRVSLGGRLGSVYAHMYNFADAKWQEAIKDEYHFTPFAALMYTTNPVSVYASYSSIHVPQTLQREDGSMLDPRIGHQAEVGAKSQFLNNKLNFDVALFYMMDDGRAYKVSPKPAYINAGRVENLGVDFEARTYPCEGLELMASYTYLHTNISKSSDGDEGLAFSPVEPEHTLKFFASYRFISGVMKGFALGANVMFQTESYASVLTPERNQPAYALLNAFASYDICKYVSVHFNVNNICDQVYYARLGGNGDYFGDPRNYTLSLRCKF